LHLYAAEMENRVRLIALMGLLAAGLGAGAGRLLEELDLPVAFGAPSAMTTFALLFFVFDRWAWRVKLPLLPRLSRIPDLRGSWKGGVEIKSVDGEKQKLPCLVLVEQRWSQLSIVFHTPRSTSRSSSMTLRGDGNVLGDIRYEYHVTPRAGHEIAGMGLHDGVARLNRLGESWTRLDGDFFNDQHFQASGRYWMNRTEYPVDVQEWLADNVAAPDDPQPATVASLREAAALLLEAWAARCRRLS
jgi:SMODS-associating 2TM, beta-strand rich effector domain